MSGSGGGGDVVEAATATPTDPSSEFNRFANDLRSSGSFRRSLFRRRRRRQNNDSGDKTPTESRLHTSQSDASLNSSCSSHNTAPDIGWPSTVVIIMIHVVTDGLTARESITGEQIFSKPPTF
jgi:hypothetical protein